MDGLLKGASSFIWTTKAGLSTSESFLFNTTDLGPRFERFLQFSASS